MVLAWDRRVPFWRLTTTQVVSVVIEDSCQITSVISVFSVNEKDHLLRLVERLETSRKVDSPGVGTGITEEWD